MKTNYYKTTKKNMKSESNSLLSKDTHISANECHDVYLAEAQSLLEKLT